MDWCTKSFHFPIFFVTLCFGYVFLFVWSVPPSVWLCPLPQQHPQPPLRRYTWSVWAPPVSRWVGLLHLQIAAMAPLCATRSVTRHWLERTQSGMKKQTSVQMLPAVCWRAWRSGLSIRCGWGHTLMWAQALRVPQWHWKPKKMVGWHLSLTSLFRLFCVCAAACHCFSLQYLPFTSINFGLMKHY